MGEAFAQLPAEAPVQVRFFERSGAETWVRRFGAAPSRATYRGEAVCSSNFGPLSFGFQLSGDASGLAMQLRRW